MAKKAKKVFQLYIFTGGGKNFYFYGAKVIERPENMEVILKGGRRRVAIDKATGKEKTIRDGTAKWVGVPYEIREIPMPDWWNKR